MHFYLTVLHKCANSRLRYPVFYLLSATRKDDQQGYLVYFIIKQVKLVCAFWFFWVLLALHSQSFPFSRNSFSTYYRGNHFSIKRYKVVCYLNFNIAGEPLPVPWVVSKTIAVQSYLRPTKLFWASTTRSWSGWKSLETKAIALTFQTPHILRFCLTEER